MTEPAVSVAVAALRKELGDELFVASRPRDRADAGRPPAGGAGGRDPRPGRAGPALGRVEPRSRAGWSSPPPRGGRAHRAADRAVRRARRRAGGRRQPSRRARRSPRRSSTGARTSRSALTGRRPRRSPPPPFLRCRLIIVAAPSHPLAAARAIAPAALGDEHWLAAADLDPRAGAFFARHGLVARGCRRSRPAPRRWPPPRRARASCSTLSHAVADEVRRRALVRLDVRGTPIVEMWHASTLGLGRALPAALALQRFATTPEATQAISSGRAGAVSAGARPRRTWP